MTSNAFCPPSQLQLALALAVVKSKPPNTNITDHILGLRKHIRTGRRAEIPAADDRNLDSAAFWRQAYEESAAAQSRLLDRIYELEQENEILRLAKDQVVPASQSQPAKRKLGSSDGPTSDFVTGSCKQSKGSKRKNTGVAKQSDDQEQFRISFEVPQDPTSSLMRRFYSLRRHLHKKTDPDALTAHCVALCTAAADSITSTVGCTGAHLGPDLGQVLDGIEQFYPCQLQSLKRLSNSQNAGPNTSGVVIYHIVQLYRTSLEQLHRYSLSMAKQVTAARKKTQRTKTKSGVDSSGDGLLMPASENHQVLNSFSSLLITMIVSLDPLREEQRDLLEGLLFILLEDVGKILGLFVFKDLNSDAKLRANAAKLPLPHSLAQIPTNSVQFSAHVQASEWEVKYLISIVDNVLVFLQRHGLASETTSATPKPSEAAHSPPSHFLQLNRDKLQNTLLTGVFGTNDPEFSGSLKLPRELPVSSTDITTTIQEPDRGVWFTQELWRILGWNVLESRKGPD